MTAEKNPILLCLTRHLHILIAPNRLHVAGITYGRMADGRFAYTASVTDVFARRIVGRACATTMNTEEPPLQALEQAIAWAASHGGTDGLARHGD